ncbi:MAG: ketose-bisphosphate aldolase [Actinobacteria bacterium]|nr:ketose-bisphosphate aldolase [Actinomycetota bacterium]
MPVASSEQYAEMIDRAKKGGFAYPAINVSSSQTVNAVLQGLTEAGSDGILQVTTGGGDYWSGPSVKNMATGAAAMAQFVREVAKNYPITVGIHTDHCSKDHLDGFLLPLLEISKERVRSGQEALFNSQMWDGSAVSLTENLEIAKKILAETSKLGVILEVEIGVVGGEEDGVVGGEGEHLYSTIEDGMLTAEALGLGENGRYLTALTGEHLYSTIEDGMLTAEALGLGENGRYLTALTFGNVHGVYKSGNVVLRPELLKDIQDAVGKKYGKDKPFDLVFHGGSGSTEKEIADAVSFGVVKMNIDTDTQYAFTRAIAGHMFANYDGVLKIDGEVGNKKAYDPRAWGKIAEAAMAKRVALATQELGSAGR